MQTIYIPKLARNKYNYVKGADGNMYVTQSQLTMSSSGSGGGGGGGGNVIPSQWEYKIEQMLNDRGYTTYDQFKTVNGYSIVGYGDIEVGSEGTVDLSPYMTKQEMSSYVSWDDLTRSSYATQAYVSTECEAIKEACYAYTDSKSYAPSVDLSSYVTRSEFNGLVDAIISYMKQSGDLVDATYVTEKIAEVVNP